MSSPAVPPADVTQRSPHGDTSVVQDEQTLIAQTTAGRREGDDSRDAVRELLRRAAERNRHALDRLAR
jgi:hypothetical protein